MQIYAIINKTIIDEVIIMKIAICDDEKIYRDQIADIINEYANNNPDKNITCSVFQWAEELLEASNKIGGFDICILDILMPEFDGIELGTQLRESGFEGKVIYLTSSEEFALDSYKVKAYDYILKPVNKDKLIAVLDEVSRLFFTKIEKSIIVKTKEKSVRVTLDSIMYAELNRRVITYHLTNGTSVSSTTVRTTFSEAVQDLLRDNRFILCGASMIINLQHINMVENESLLFKDNSSLHLSKKVCREVRSAWYDFWFNEEET